METLHHKTVSTRRRFLKALMVLAALPVMPARAQVGLDVGQKAPDFSAAGLDGKTQRLSTVTAASRATVVYFWATWCSPCIGEFPELETMYRKLKDQGVTLLSINFKETVSTAKTFAEDAGRWQDRRAVFRLAVTCHFCARRQGHRAPQDHWRHQHDCAGSENHRGHTRRLNSLRGPSALAIGSSPQDHPAESTRNVAAPAEGLAFFYHSNEQSP